MNHIEHLKNLLKNSECFTQDKDRAINSFASKIRLGKGSTKKEISIKIAELVWNAQEGLPIYHQVHDGLYTSWNSPMKGGWNIDYIKYEICHDIPYNIGGNMEPTNLFYGSAQCNRCHGALSISSWVKYLDKKDITKRYNAVKLLHTSNEFINLVKELNS
jgi:hypothetical protein